VYLPSLPVLSSSFERSTFGKDIWSAAIFHLRQENLISKAEQDRLRQQDFSLAPKNTEAQRRICQFLSSIVMINEIEQNNLLKNFSVSSMPSLTIIVPFFAETVTYDENAINDSSTGRLTLLEFLKATYTDEWNNLAEKLSKDVEAGPANQEKIAVWASMRGQTAVRTIRGLVNARVALFRLAQQENPQMSVANLVKLVYHKVQIIFAAQIYQDLIGSDKYASRNFARQFEIMDRYLFDSSEYENPNDALCAGYDLVYDYTDRATKEYFGVMKEVRPPGSMKPKSYVIERPGPLVLGEGKAENQMHGLMFAFGEVLQVNDMNQYNTFENSLKLPYCLDKYFKMHKENLRTETPVPKYRILGFPEHSYSRSVTHLGELAGAAEWSFVTIVQRILFEPLRVRGHYGHPDFMDGYWARTRGGPSKGSTKVNVNEDIFAAYEVFGRGEDIGYVEYLEQQKGRETGFYEVRPVDVFVS